MKTAIADNNAVESTYLLKNDARRHVLGVQFTADAATTIATATDNLRGRRLLVVFEGMVVAAPVIKDAIRGGRAIIDFGESHSPRTHKQELIKLACAMSAQSLTSSVKVLDIRVVWDVRVLTE